ncbi:hypothetical protein HZS_162 [Henneguya salminicola]|nr:hypothetical protein HZS_162 [Henneguya salminicola]
MVKERKPKRRSLTNIATVRFTKKRLLEENFDKLSQSTLYEYYHIRRSSRTTENEKKIKEKNDLQEKIIKGIEIGLEAKESPGKGRGVFTKTKFKKGDYIIEYIGALIDYKTALTREKNYQKTNAGSYILNIQYASVDATIDVGKLGRLLNHSRLNFNLISKIIEIANVPRIVFFAARDISIGEELLYDYGDRTPTSLRNHPWLRY